MLKNGVESDFTIKKSIIGLSIIVIIALAVRLFYYNPEIPPTSDALAYFYYAIDTSISGHLPTDYSPANNGWPAFLGMVFSTIHFSSITSYMQLQFVSTIVISTLTIIPTFVLCNKLVGRRIALVGASIIAFEPRLIQNSLLGISDTLYIFLVASIFALFLNNDKRIIFISFGIAALASIVRAEGIFVFFAISVMFLIRFRNEGKIIVPKFLIALSIFSLVILPMAAYKIDIHGDDRIFGRAAESISASYYVEEKSPILTGLENFPKFLIWDMIPVFIFLMPIGVYYLFKKVEYKKLTIIFGVIFCSIPAFYVYTIPIPETRYFFFLYPLFSVVSVLFVENIVGKVKQKDLITWMIIAGVLTGSILFNFWNMIDYEYESESLLVANTIVSIAGGINQYEPEHKYVTVVDVINRWNEMESIIIDQDRIEGETLRKSFPYSVKMISTDGYNSLNNFILENQDKGLTHLIIDENPNRPDFLKDVFYNETKYSYLEKVYDSNDELLRYKAKIFKINYELIDKSFQQN
ncbi:MAG: hypothetical protein DWQ18_09355 [Crenarchaeota archaeon]|nr:MAG: hypothetical protein DWQ17_00430 [Thermoproteota archaeon]RDJ33334.1 MAG: hypothetical protein DWQ18_09355 [Thermoproteota archaeon]RDJ36163.1 MAG: hypothetical protein DWQ19_05965 [Thermoproteota archaeon]RDJ38794.1 MAG: hypothetical protein DWQ13_00430 [Thermoproteota archaeon]